jgi:hypothetical protein
LLTLNGLGILLQKLQDSTDNPDPAVQQIRRNTVPFQLEKLAKRQETEFLVVYSGEGAISEGDEPAVKDRSGRGAECVEGEGGAAEEGANDDVEDVNLEDFGLGRWAFAERVSDDLGNDLASSERMPGYLLAVNTHPIELSWQTKH